MAGLSVAPSAQAAMTDVATNQAANYVATHLPKKSRTSANIESALALASTGQCTYAAPLRTLVKRLEGQAKTFAKGKPAAAAKLAIVVDAVGLNPKKFGKQNLVSAITKGLPSNGDVGNYPFSQALALIALDRADAKIPDRMVTRLLGQQNSDGSFGVNDPDSTAVAITALRSVADSTQEKAALAKALAWAENNQTAAGYWKNYSPVDSTGLLGAAAQLSGKTGLAADAHAWLLDKQLANGGFANTLTGTKANLMSTSNALWLLSGTDLATVSLKLSACGKTPPALLKTTKTCNGVWVVVDRGNGQATTRCATKYSTGVKALRSAGFSVKTFDTQYGASVCQIRKFPAKCDKTFGSGYWSYWNSVQNADGTWGEWTYAMSGPATSKPARGTAEAHLWVPSSIPWDASPAPKPSVKAPNGYTATPVPVISGSLKVGKKLQAKAGAWAPAPDKFSYRWYRNGKPIKGATSKSYKLKKADKGKKITVKVTARGAGLETRAVKSAKTAKIK